MIGSPSPICPRCRQRAPVVLRGLESRCAACGAPRFLLAAPSISLAGQPSRLGGIAASIAGGATLVMGLSLSAGLWFLLQSFWPDSLLGWAFALPLAAASLVFGLLLLIGGRKLRKSGMQRRQQVQLEAVRAIIQHRRGPVSAFSVANELALPELEVDELLMLLARERATAVTVDVDQGGHIVYDFEGEERRWRVLEEEVGETIGGVAESDSQRLRR